MKDNEKESRTILTQKDRKIELFIMFYKLKRMESSMDDGI